MCCTSNIIFCDICCFRSASLRMGAPQRRRKLLSFFNNNSLPVVINPVPNLNLISFLLIYSQFRYHYQRKRYFYQRLDSHGNPISLGISIPMHTSEGHRPIKDFHFETRATMAENRVQISNFFTSCKH